MKTSMRNEFEGSWSWPVRFRGATALAAAAVLMLVVLAEGLPFGAAADLTAVDQTELRNSTIILAKNTLIAVNQGNLTGNYTVLRDLSSPGFRERNSCADLAAIFENLRKQKIDLSPTVLIDPVLARPKLNDEGLLLLKGYFPSEPVRINFELMYLKSATGGWMIHGVSINTEPAGALAANKTEQTTPPPSASPGTRSSRVIPASNDAPDGETAAPRAKSAPAPSSSAPVRRAKP